MILIKLPVPYDICVIVGSWIVGSLGTTLIQGDSHLNGISISLLVSCQLEDISIA